MRRLTWATATCVCCCCCWSCCWRSWIWWCTDNGAPGGSVPETGSSILGLDISREGSSAAWNQKKNCNLIKCNVIWYFSSNWKFLYFKKKKKNTQKVEDTNIHIKNETIVAELHNTIRTIRTILPGEPVIWPRTQNLKCRIVDKLRRGFEEPNSNSEIISVSTIIMSFELQLSFIHRH